MSRIPKQYHANGRPVPFITLWSGEKERYIARSEAERARMLAMSGEQKRMTLGRLPSSWWVPPHNVGMSAIAVHQLLAVEPAGGWWWKAVPNMRGQGEPIWAQVHEGRQRKCMVGFKCQVCGVQLREPSDEEPFLWLVSQIAGLPDGSKGTYDAPSCPECLDVALRLCPALRRTHLLLEVVSAPLWGALGRCYTREDAYETREADEEVTMVAIPDSVPAARQFYLAGQRIRRLANYEVINMHQKATIWP